MRDIKSNPGKFLLALVSILVMISLAGCPSPSPTPSASVSPTATRPAVTATASPAAPPVTATAARAPIMRSVSADVLVKSTPTVIPSPVGSATPAVNPTSAPAPAATVTATSPLPGTADVKISVSVDQFQPVNPTPTIVPGQGHFHYYIDVDVPTTQGRPAVTAPGTYVVTTSSTFTWTNVTPGKHTFGVQLVNNSHTPLFPPVYQLLVVMVPPSAPTSAPYISTLMASFSAPKAGLLIPASPASPPATTPTNPTSMAASASQVAGAVDITMSVKVQNFNIVDKQGQTPVPGEGHVHYYLDVDVPTAQGAPAVTATGTWATTTSTSFTWTNVPPGRHTLSVQLVNNDHTPLSTPVFAQAIVNVLSPVIATTSP